MAITSWGDFGRHSLESEEDRLLRRAFERTYRVEQGPQTDAQMVDISTPPYPKPFELPAQMLPQPERTVVPAGNPFLQEQFAPSVSPNPQYRPPTPVPGLLGGGIPTSQTIGSDALRTISEQMQADPSMRPENLNFPTPQFNPSRPDVSMSNRGDVGQDRSQTPNSVFGNDIGSSLADAMSAVANKIGQKRFNQPSPSMSVDQSRGATIGIQDQLGVEQSIADSMNSQQAQDEAARRAQALRQQTPTGDGSALTNADVDTDIEGEKIVANAIGADTDTDGGFPLINNIVPAGGSALFGKREVAEKFTEQVKQKEAESPGFVKRMLSNPNLFPYLAMAFNTMRLNPDPSLNAAMMKTVEANNEFRRSNRTADTIQKMATKPDGSVDSKMLQIAEMVRNGQIDPKSAMTAVLKKPDPSWRLMTREEVAQNPMLDPDEAYKIDQSSGDIKPISTSMFPGEDEQKKQYAKAIVDRNMQIIDAGEKSIGKLDKIEETKAMILSPTFEAGPFARIRTAVDRLKSVLWNDEEAKWRVEEAEAIESLLGSEVFGAIGELGIGARGLDTPAEREFLRKVMAGDFQMNEATLLYMVQIRENIQRRAIEKYNDAIDSGRLAKYEKEIGQKLQKIEVPESKYKIESLDDARRVIAATKGNQTNLDEDQEYETVDSLREKARQRGQ